MIDSSYKFMDDIHSDYKGDSRSIVEKYFYIHSDFKKSFVVKEKEYPITAEWLPYELKSTFRKNSEKDSRLNYYKDNPLIYSFNKYFHRSPDIESLPDTIDLYLGDSQTFGVGIHEKDTWVTKLGKYLEFPYYNAGQGGSGIMTSFRLLKQISKIKKIRNVFYLVFLGYPRFEYFDYKEESYMMYGVDDLGYTDMEKSLVDDKNLSLMYNALFDAMAFHCQKTGINFIPMIASEVGYIVGSLDEFSKHNNYTPTNIPARDLMHFGVDRHHLIFSAFVKKYLHLIEGKLLF